MTSFDFNNPTVTEKPDPVITQVVYRLIGGGLARAAYNLNGKDPVAYVERLLGQTLIGVDSVAPEAQSGDADLYICSGAVAAVIFP